MSSNKPSTALSRIRVVFIADDGRLRAVWLTLLTMAGWPALSALVSAITGRLLALLFAGWGVTPSNLYLAPAWVRYIAKYQLHIAGCFTAALAAACSALLMHPYRKRDTAANERAAHIADGATAFLTGVLLPLALTAIFLLCDSMRTTTATPVITADMALMLPVCLLTALAECFVAFGYVGRAVTLRCCRYAGAAAAALMFIVMNMSGIHNVLSAINTLLTAVVLHTVACRYGLGACIALRTGWLWSLTALSGLPGSVSGLFSVYHVSEALLTGGHGGLTSGIAVTLVCAAVIIAPVPAHFIRNRIKS